MQKDPLFMLYINFLHYDHSIVLLTSSRDHLSRVIPHEGNTIFKVALKLGFKTRPGPMDLYCFNISLPFKNEFVY